MAGRTFQYAELNAGELAALDPDRTIVLMALSPLEVHGPHLPIGCDVIIAQELQRRLLARLTERYPDYDRLVLPPVYAGADTIPVPGSLKVDSRAIYYLLLSVGRSLAEQGFRYLLLTDNHGGPRHQIAVEKAVRKVYKERRFSIVAPFLNFYRRMVENDPALLEATGTGPGSTGDLTDAHAGRNETSLMLATAPDQVAPGWRSLPWVVVGRGFVARGLVKGGSAVLRLLRARRLAADLPALAMDLGWVAAGAKVTYVGEPRMASVEAGERMLEAHVEEGMAQLESAMRGELPYSRPLLWSIRWVERS
jgi:creatinine amidohydrolase/Fe(II)-dependent formamide hydrolase-like protein